MIRYICRSYLPYRWMIRRKVFHPSLDRLAELSAVDSEDADSLAAASAEFSRILQNLQVRGVWKWTGRNRLVRMDRLLSAHVAAERWTTLSMLDVGASDGITSLDTVEHLRQANGVAVSVTIMDKETRLLRLRRHGTVLYFTPSLRPVLIRFWHLGLCLEPMQGLEGVVFNRAAAALTCHCARRLTRADVAAARSIPMVNPAVAHSESIELCERDLFDENPKWSCAFNVVRASNVLVRSYYTEDRIRDALTIAHRYLREGGVLVVSRNLIGKRDETETGGLWRKAGAGFIPCAMLDVVPEIAGLIDSLRVSATTKAP